MPVDPTELEQIVVNLVVNARDPMPRGGELAIATQRVERTYRAVDTGDAARIPHALLVVADTGVGIAAEARSRLFEPFFTTKQPELGTGLGLATVHAIVERARGQVWFESEPGRGTTFKISFPWRARRRTERRRMTERRRLTLEPAKRLNRPLARLPEITELLIFITAVDERSIRRAGHRLHISLSPGEVRLRRRLLVLVRLRR